MPCSRFLVVGILWLICQERSAAQTWISLEADSDSGVWTWEAEAGGASDWRASFAVKPEGNGGDHAFSLSWGLAESEWFWGSGALANGLCFRLGPDAEPGSSKLWSSSGGWKLLGFWHRFARGARVDMVWRQGVSGPGPGLFAAQLSSNPLSWVQDSPTFMPALCFYAARPRGKDEEEVSELVAGLSGALEVRWAGMKLGLWGQALGGRTQRPGAAFSGSFDSGKMSSKAGRLAFRFKLSCSACGDAWVNPSGELPIRDRSIEAEAQIIHSGWSFILNARSDSESADPEDYSRMRRLREDLSPFERFAWLWKTDSLHVGCKARAGAVSCRLAADAGSSGLESLDAQLSFITVFSNRSRALGGGFQVTAKASASLDLGRDRTDWLGSLSGWGKLEGGILWHPDVSWLQSIDLGLGFARRREGKGSGFETEPSYSLSIRLGSRDSLAAGIDIASPVSGKTGWPDLSLSLDLRIPDTAFRNPFPGV